MYLYNAVFINFGSYCLMYFGPELLTADCTSVSLLPLTSWDHGDASSSTLKPKLMFYMWIQSNTAAWEMKSLWVAY